MDAIEIFKGSYYYSNLLDSFYSDVKLDSDFKGTAISEAIYFHLCKMKYAGWRHRVNFKRSRKHSISEFFQDIIAFYLKAALPSDYEVEVEKKIGTTQPDIAIRHGSDYVFLIELKTNIGWQRPDTTARDPWVTFRNRIDELSSNFKVPHTNIIYIFEEYSNVSQEFSDKFWDEELQKPQPRPADFPFSVIYPLFNGTDPFYWTEYNKLNKRAQYADIKDEDIKRRAKSNIVTPIEDIIRIILNATQPERIIK